MTALVELSARAVGAAVARREASAVEVCRAHLERAASEESRVGAYLSLDEDRALERARAVDERLARGESASPLAGVPVAVKDNLCTTDEPTTCASRLLEGFVPRRDATAVERLRRAGAVVLGKTNMDEFGMGLSTEHSAFQLTRNPRDVSRVPGGSSGGSAAAVASGSAPLALGSDTGGSIRQPAAFCGVVGVVPSYGRVSRLGLVAFASSLDQVGPLARSVADAAALLEAVAGHDARDATSRDLEPLELDSVTSERVDARPFRFGVLRAGAALAPAPDVARRLASAAAALERCGGERTDVRLAHLDVAVATYRVVSSAEASSNLARFDGIRYGRRAEGARDVVDLVTRTRDRGFGLEVQRRILLGTFVLSAGHREAYYRQALRVRALLSRDFDDALARCDVLLLPTTPGTAFELGSKVEDPVAMILEDLFTVPSSLAGLPAVSVPCGRGDDGLPVGAQLVGRRFGERELLEIASLLERELGEEPCP